MWCILQILRTGWLWLFWVVKTWNLWKMPRAQKFGHPKGGFQGISSWWRHQILKNSYIDNQRSWFHEWPHILIKIRKWWFFKYNKGKITMCPFELKSLSRRKKLPSLNPFYQIRPVTGGRRARGGGRLWGVHMLGY